ncbi:unnamed protein product, partial [Brassica oleracea var. botrytis]
GFSFGEKKSFPRSLSFGSLLRRLESEATRSISVSLGFSLRLVSNLSPSRLRPSRLRSSLSVCLVSVRLSPSISLRPSLSVRLSPPAVRLVCLSPSARLHLKPKTDTVSLINIPSSSTASLTSEILDSGIELPNRKKTNKQRKNLKGKAQKTKAHHRFTQTR